MEHSLLLRNFKAFPVTWDQMSHLYYSHLATLFYLIQFNPLNTLVTYKAKTETAKAVPLHAMEALGGRRDIAPTHS
jgi:hypothetical protein